uniref:Uncharacterized protein n=1 Tax=Anopheles atroparvus TaxID=41427 RepID=A0A182ITX5_ANOAO
MQMPQITPDAAGTIRLDELIIPAPVPSVHGTSGALGHNLHCHLESSSWYARYKKLHALVGSAGAAAGALLARSARTARAVHLSTDTNAADGATLAGSTAGGGVVHRQLMASVRLARMVSAPIMVMRTAAQLHQGARLPGDDGLVRVQEPPPAEQSSSSWSLPSISLGGVDEARCACACFAEAGEVLDRFAHTPTTLGGCFGSGGLELNTWLAPARWLPPVLALATGCCWYAYGPPSPLSAVLESERYGAAPGGRVTAISQSSGSSSAPVKLSSTVTPLVFIWRMWYAADSSVRWPRGSFSGM